MTDESRRVTRPHRPLLNSYQLIYRHLQELGRQEIVRDLSMPSESERLARVQDEEVPGLIASRTNLGIELVSKVVLIWVF